MSRPNGLESAAVQIEGYCKKGTYTATQITTNLRLRFLLLVLRSRGQRLGFGNRDVEMAGDNRRVVLALQRMDYVRQKFPKSNVSWLSAEEQNRYGSFTTDIRRQQFLCGRLLAREALSHMCGGPWHAYLLTAPEGRAPRTQGNSELDEMRSLSISISHTKGWVACAVSRSSVGVDIQSREKTRDIQGLSQLIECDFSLEADQSTMNLQRVFYAQWGLREAWVKQCNDASRLVATPRFGVGKDTDDDFNGLVSDVGDATLVVYPARIEAIEMTRESVEVQNWSHWHQLSEAQAKV
jgi:phosphopantetheinyl transferase